MDSRQIVKNPGLRALAKLMLNSFWGKYTKQKNEERHLYFINVSFLILGKFAQRPKLFTKKSHHGNLSVIYIVQNLFHHSKEHRTISLNASYLCLTKNVRDAIQIVHLAKQLYPNNTKFFQQAYQLTTKEPYWYLFVDLTPTCPDEIRVRSGIFPTSSVASPTI